MGNFRTDWQALLPLVYLEECVSMENRCKVQLADLPEGVLQHLAFQLERLTDRRALASCCRRLRQASKYWFPQISTEINSVQDARALADWLQTHQSSVTLSLGRRMRRHCPETTAALQALHGLPLAAFDGSGAGLLAAVAAGQGQGQGQVHLASWGPTLRCLRCLWMGLDSPAIAPNIFRHASSLTQLTELVLTGFLQLPPEVTALAPTLRDLTFNAGGLGLIPARRLPPPLAALTRLTKLQLSMVCVPAGDASWQALCQLAPALRELQLVRCGLAALPPPLSSLAGLTKLDLGLNDRLRFFLEFAAPVAAAAVAAVAAAAAQLPDGDSSGEDWSDSEESSGEDSEAGEEEEGEEHPGGGGGGGGGGPGFDPELFPLPPWVVAAGSDEEEEGEEEEQQQQEGQAGAAQAAADDEGSGGDGSDSGSDGGIDGSDIEAEVVDLADSDSSDSDSSDSSDSDSSDGGGQPRPHCSLALLAPSNLAHLASLSLAGCKLGRLPVTLSTLTVLTALNLQGNELSERQGTGWGHLLPLAPRLQRLRLADNRLRSLPAELGALSALTYLQLSRNQLGRPPTDPGGGAADGWDVLAALAGSLQVLQADACSLAQLPPVLLQLTALHVLELADNSQLGGSGDSAGWGRLGGLVNLQGLNLAGCQLAQLPPVLSCLTGLQLLDVCGNPLPLGGSGSSGSGGGWRSRTGRAGRQRGSADSGGWEHLQPLRWLQQLRLPLGVVPGVQLPPGVFVQQCPEEAPLGWWNPL